MRKFHPGQKVVYVSKYHVKGSRTYGYGETLTIDSYSLEPYWPKEIIYVKEHPLLCYSEDDFIPLVEETNERTILEFTTQGTTLRILYCGTINEAKEYLRQTRGNVSITSCHYLTVSNYEKVGKVWGFNKATINDLV